MVRELSPEKRAAFLSAALKLFVANGVQNTSTADIAREAGTAAGTLFIYFPTKLDLIHELILGIGKQQSEYIKSLLDPSLSVRETFFTIWKGSVDWFLANPDAYQYNQQVRDSGLIAPEVTEESAKFFDYFYTAIQRGLAEGILKPYPLALIGGFLYQDIVAMMNLLRTQADLSQQAESIQLGFDIFWSGIKNNEKM
jgi:TetR/AcrR family transcriptional regulator, repressor of fatR-cypB operon